MTIGLLLALFAAALALGAAMHVALYAPTAALPPMWRNMTRYALGVTAVFILLAIAIALAPDMALWWAYVLGLALARANRGVDVWLYNRRDGFDGLAAQMREMGATKYLHWSAEWKENPLAVVSEDGFEVLPGMWALLRELKALEEVTLEGLNERLTAVEAKVFGQRLASL